MGFLGDDMTQTMLPLMINFEAKSISTRFPELKATMQKRLDYYEIFALRQLSIFILISVSIIAAFFIFHHMCIRTLLLFYFYIYIYIYI